MTVNAIQRDPIVRVFESRGVFSFATKAFTIASKTLQVTGSAAAQYVPYLSIANAPISIYRLLKQISGHVRTLKVANVAKERLFWSMRIIGAVGDTIGGIVKPFVGGAALAGLNQIKQVQFTFNKVLPIILLVTDTIGMIASAWRLGRTIQEYKRFNADTRPVNDFYAEKLSGIDQAFFNECYKPFEQNLDNRFGKELHSALLRGIRFTIYEHTNLFLTSVMGVVAATLFMMGSQYCLPASGLVIGSASLGIVPLILKNYFIWKHSM